MKSDNEPAIVKLLTETLRELRINGLEQVMEEHPPEYDPQANGSAELGVRLLKGHLRTMRSDLETKLGYRVPMRHPLMAWMVTHAANVITWYARGTDGMTAYQRVRTRSFKTRMLGFGEMCKNKNRSHEPVGNFADGRKWHLGVFVGIDPRTGQYMVHCGDSVKLARTIVRLPELNKWDCGALSEVNATPWDLRQPRGLDVIFKEATECRDEDFKDKTSVARRVYINAKDLIGSGLTRGCPKCDHQL